MGVGISVTWNKYKRIEGFPYLFKTLILPYEKVGVIYFFGFSRTGGAAVWGWI
jgi:hypothetical protein